MAQRSSAGSARSTWASGRTASVYGRKLTGPTRKAVADKLRDLRRERDAGVDVRKKSMTVADLANEWLTHLEQNEGTKEEATILRLRPRVEKHIIPAERIGGRRLDQLTVAQVEAWLRREAETGGPNGKPQARVTCRDYKQMLGEMVEWASSTPLWWPC